MGDSQQPVEFVPGEFRRNPDRAADARQEVEIVVFEVFVAVERQPCGANEPVARERDRITFRRRFGAPPDVGFGQRFIVLAFELRIVMIFSYSGWQWIG